MYIPASSVQEFSFLFASLWYAFLSSFILMGGWWYLIKVIIHITVMTNDVEHLFICLFAIYPFYLFIICFLFDFLDFLVYFG